MKPSEQLFDLVKSLTKSEKRFFKMQSALQSGEKNYLRIFEYIDSQEDYDEEHLKDHFKGETFIKHLPSEKNHLYKLILKSLRSYHSGRSISSQLKLEIRNVEVLYQKALYEECAKYVKRAKRIASDYEMFYYWTELIHWEKKLLEDAYESGRFDQDLDALIEEEKLVIAKLRNLAEYQMLYSRINFLFRRGGFSRNEAERKAVDEIADYHLIKGKNTAISTRATSICYYIKGLCAAANRDFSEAYVNFSKVKKVLDANPRIREDLPHRYVRTFGHLLSCYLESGRWNDAQSIVDQLNTLEDKDKSFRSTDVKRRIFFNASLGQTVIYGKTGRFEMAESYLPDVEHQLYLMKGKLNHEQELLFNYNIAYLYFGDGNFKKSLQFLNKILNANLKRLREDIQGFSRIFNMLVHYELGNYDLVDYIAKSTLRFLDKQNNEYQVDTVIVKKLRKLAKAKDNEKRDAILIDFRKELDELFKNQEEKVILRYLDIQSWVISKCEGRDFGDVVKEKAGY